MATMKLNISLDTEVVETLRRRAAELRKPASRYLADLIQDDARRHQDELAAEGYRLLSADTSSFAAAAWPLTAETWPEWESEVPDSAAEHDPGEERARARETQTEERGDLLGQL